MYPGKMNLPTQSICLPSVAASCLPIETRSILSPLITTVAFGITLPSAGLITVAPTSEIFSEWAGVTARNAESSTKPKMRTRFKSNIKHLTSNLPFILSIRDRFFRGFETDLGMGAVAKRFLGRRAATTERHPRFDRELVSVGVDQLHFALHD